MCVLCVSSISCFFAVTNSCLALHICQGTLQDMLKPSMHNDSITAQNIPMHCGTCVIELQSCVHDWHHRQKSTAVTSAMDS